MTVLRRVLVPLDGSHLADRVLEPLRPLLGAGSDVTLLRVVPPHGPMDTDIAPAAERALRRQAHELQGRWGLAAAVHVLVARGEPAEEIVLRAEEADLVAMSTHGRTGAARLVRGSVAESVLRRCRAPLLLCNPHALAHPGAGRFSRVLVALDGSAEADAILPVVEAVARGHEAQVTLLRVEEPAAPDRGLAAQRDRLRAAGVGVEVRVVHSDQVVTELLRAAEGADLLAMTTHGREGVARWWYGSVAEEVLRRARCPVLALRSAGAAATSGSPSP